MTTEKMIERLEYWEEEDQKLQKALESYMAVVAPNSYSPLIERDLVSAFLGAFDKETKDWLEYYIYEAKTMDKCAVESGGKKYDFKKKEDVIEFFNDLKW